MSSSITWLVGSFVSQFKIGELGVPDLVLLQFGSLWEGWCSNGVQGTYGVCLWKNIRKGWDTFHHFVAFKVGGWLLYQILV